MNRLEQQIADLVQKLQALDAERETLSQTLASLRQQHHQQQQQNFVEGITKAAVNHQSSRQDKINIFRKLFKGREDAAIPNLKLYVFLGNKFSPYSINCIRCCQ